VRILIGILLLIHGLITAGISLGMLGGGNSAPRNPSWLSWWPTPVGRSWLLSILGLEPSAISRLFAILWVVGGICFLASGVGIFIGQEWWRTLTIVGAALSVVVLVIYLHPWYWFALALNAGIFVALWWAHWPPAGMVGS
jgi:hypothetical protein